MRFGITCNDRADPAHELAAQEDLRLDCDEAWRRLGQSFFSIEQRRFSKSPTIPHFLLRSYYTKM
jgi:hypothetical protein